MTGTSLQYGKSTHDASVCKWNPEDRNNTASTEELHLRHVITAMSDWMR
jgi:hypothetical protein